MTRKASSKTATYTNRASAVRGAKRALYEFAKEGAQFEIIENADGTFSWKALPEADETTAAPATGAKAKKAKKGKAPAPVEDDEIADEIERVGREFGVASTDEDDDAPTVTPEGDTPEERLANGLAAIKGAKKARAAKKPKTVDMIDADTAAAALEGEAVKKGQAKRGGDTTVAAIIAGLAARPEGVIRKELVHVSGWANAGWNTYMTKLAKTVGKSLVMTTRQDDKGRDVRAFRFAD